MGKKERKRNLAFVLAGGGSRGALQVGALEALLENNIVPDMIVGTSIGAVNATFIGLKGFNSDSIRALKESWRAAAKANLMPARMTWLTARILLNRLRINSTHRMREFFVSQGLEPDIRFKDLIGPKIILVSADLNSLQPVYFGVNPDDNVLDGLLASTALPPWVRPLFYDEKFLMDGGVVSNLPIEPAILHGANDIIAMGLSNPAMIEREAYGFTPFWMKLITTVEERQIYMELELAKAMGIPVCLINLTMKKAIPVWDFSLTEEMFTEGYKQMKQNILLWKDKERVSKAESDEQSWLKRFWNNLRSK